MLSACQKIFPDRTPTKHARLRFPPSTRSICIQFMCNPGNRMLILDNLGASGDSAKPQLDTRGKARETRASFHRAERDWSTYLTRALGKSKQDAAPTRRQLLSLFAQAFCLGPACGFTFIKIPWPTRVDYRSYLSSDTLAQPETPIAKTHQPPRPSLYRKAGSKPRVLPYGTENIFRRRTEDTGFHRIRPLIDILLRCWFERVPQRLICLSCGLSFHLFRFALSFFH